jgi:very-short-patch-repair endonuclease
MEALIRRQHGLVTHAQCVAAGLTRDAIAHRLRSGRWRRIHRGVYATHTLPLEALARYHAAVLACGEGAVLSHWSAAAVWRLVPHGNADPHVTTPRKLHSRKGIRVHRTRTRPKAAVRAGIPLTSLAQTLQDLKRIAPAEEVAKATRAAQRLHGYEGPTTDFTRGHLEPRFLRFLDEQGFARPQTNHLVLGYELDAYWPEQRIAIEVDDWDSHRTREAFESDRARDRRLAAAGIRVVRVTASAFAGRDGELDAELAALGLPRTG